MHPATILVWLLQAIIWAALAAWAVKYQLMLYYVGSVLVEQLPPPVGASSKVYKYVYAVIQALAANLRRAKDAAKTV
jgi:hypothetical protein